MAHPVDPGNYGQFSVIARLRQGIESSLSTLGIILEIQNHLKPYNCICNVALCSPNFIIHLPTLELQLQVLSCKTFTGSDYVMDIVPWCNEFSSFQLPWIPKAFHQGIRTSLTPSSQNTESLNILATLATDNAAGQPSAQCSTENKQADDPYKETMIIIDAINREDNTDSSIDFSYLMIVELKEFYGNKFRAFHKCEETCKEMYGIAQAFWNEIQKAIKSVYEETSVYDDAPPDSILSDIARFGGDLNNPLWFISEEILDLGMGMDFRYATNNQPIDLSSFVDHQQNEKFNIPVAVMPVLKSIAESAVLQIYAKPLLIGTAEDYDGNFHTQIWSTSFHHSYRTLAPTTQEQAETDAVYRFLKYITNILGYTITDKNCNVLSTVISEINYLSKTVSELQLYINKVVTVVQDVHEDIKEMHGRIPSEMYQEQVPHIAKKIGDLFIVLQRYTDAVEHGFQTFQQQKQVFRSIRLQSPYSSKPDE